MNLANPCLCGSDSVSQFDTQCAHSLQEFLSFGVETLREVEHKLHRGIKGRIENQGGWDRNPHFSLGILDLFTKLD